MLIPNVIFSQILNQSDIDIWVENIIKFADTIDEHDVNTKDNDWENYLNMIYRMESAFNYDADRFNDYYQTFLDIKVPDELEVFLRSIGWEKDGHRKFFTIFFSAHFLYFKRSLLFIGENNLNDFYTEKFIQINNILSLFNKDDLEIINNNLAAIIEFL
jgi:hypothetical protein